jgi:formylglycine-generating enzyme required for sulfatase activity
MAVRIRPRLALAAIGLVLVAAADVAAQGTPPGAAFRDCAECPEMVPIPTGSFRMGSPPGERGANDDERPQIEVAITAPFALGKFEVTFAEWDACVAEGGCRHRPSDRGFGRGRMPAVNVSWHDAVEYVAWLARKTGKPYRLPSEAEWEYAARAGTTTPFFTGETISTDQANYDGTIVYGDWPRGEFRGRPLAVGSFPPNPFGLHDMPGNVVEWVADCYALDYTGGRTQAAWTRGHCDLRVLRDGSWSGPQWLLRSAYRSGIPFDVRTSRIGLRVARDL